MKSVQFFALIMVAVVVSFIGFWVENIWIAITRGFMDNRNMYFPFLFGYGIAMILVYMLFGLPQSPLFFGIAMNISNPVLRNIYYYVVMVLCISIGELVLGTTVEKICTFQWWNYSHIPLHLTQYTSLPTSMGYSAVVFLFMRYCFEWLLNFFERFDNRILIGLSLSVGIVLTVDMIYNLYLIYKNKSGTVRWRVEIWRGIFASF